MYRRKHGLTFRWIHLHSISYSCNQDLHIGKSNSPYQQIRYAFTFHVVKWVGGIHYPTISIDMLPCVQSRKQWHTNSDAISSSNVLSGGKLWYYRIFMYSYAFSLRTALLMANGSWTKNRLDSILTHSDTLLDNIHFLASIRPFQIR